MTKLISITIIMCLMQGLAAQQKITGTLKDNVDGKTPEYASIVLVSVQDSNLISYTRATAQGMYTLTVPAFAGKALLMISHPDYGAIVDTVNITATTSNFDVYVLTPNRILYEQIIVKAKLAPIRIKGDTIQYTADSFKVREGANVEDLLRKLPGIQVGKNGEITAMGEKVKKVLVDGEEFFGDDPGVALKNLKADAVDKVEVFDKKSDQAAFTGIDDGVKDKTINLKLKDSKKNGYFGKLETAGGTPANYSNQGMINVFKKKRKFAAFGIMSNTGNTGLDWNDKDKYGDNDGVESGMSENGGMWMSSTGDEFNSFWGGSNGIPTNWNGGLHYSNKYNNDKQSLNLGYKYNKVNSLADSRTFSTTFLPDSTWQNNSTNNIFTSRQRNAINGTWDTQLDSNNTIKIKITAKQQRDVSSQRSTNEAFAAKPINDNTRTITATEKSEAYSTSVLWMHRFKKKARTLSWNVATSYKAGDGNSTLLAYNNFYKGGTLFKADTVDQKRDNSTLNQNFNTKISYTEPLSKVWVAEVALALASNKNVNDRNTFDKGTNGKYETLVPLLSNHFQFNTQVTTPSLSFKYNKKKVNASLGTKLGINKFTQTNLTTTEVQQYSFTNVFPNANINMKFKGNKGLSVSYNGSGTAPSLNQLQPIVDNSNPFYIRTGNPNLKQNFRHNIDANFNSWDVLTERSIWAYVNATITQNDFTEFNNIDSLGRTVSKSVNVNGNRNVSGSMNYRFKVKAISTSIGLGPSLSISRNVDFVNAINNVNNNTRYGISVNMNKWKDEKWGFWMQHDISQNNTKSTINNRSSINFWSVTGNASIWWPVTKKIGFNVDTEYELRQRNKQFPLNNNYCKINTNLNYKIKKDVWQVYFEVKDVLNQNRGFNRSFSSYNYTESFYTTLRRFYMLGLTYNFNSQKSTAKK